MRARLGSNNTNGEASSSKKRKAIEEVGAAGKKAKTG